MLFVFVASPRTARRSKTRTRETAAVEFVASAISVGNGCELPKTVVDTTLDDAARTWRVDDAYFEGHDLQDVVDCASDGDTVWLNTSIPILPRRQVEVSKRLEIRGARGDEESSATDTPAKATLTCPRDDSLFSIRSVMERCH